MATSNFLETLRAGAGARPRRRRANVAYRDQPPERIARIAEAICRLHEKGCHPLDLFAELQHEFEDLTGACRKVWKWP